MQHRQSPITDIAIQHVGGFMVATPYDPNIRVTAATPVQGRAAWHGEYKLGSGAWAMWLTVTNGQGEPIAYASEAAAEAGARHKRYHS